MSPAPPSKKARREQRVRTKGDGKPRLVEEEEVHIQRVQLRGMSLRIVRPYRFEFRTYVKQRWLGHSLLDICAKEFVAYPVSHYEAAVASGEITLNEKRCTADQILEANDLLVHRAVCRENPVLGLPVKILGCIGEVLAVDKPCSLPVHPSGGYRYNSLTEILAGRDGDFISGELPDEGRNHMKGAF
jgi:tRNA pseudouridine synthase 8/2,5-diamino-6-(5-phospho-D-ribitylamino)-pyrimidin-4(3H)-one deaminase